VLQGPTVGGTEARVFTHASALFGVTQARFIVESIFARALPVCLYARYGELQNPTQCHNTAKVSNCLG